MQDVFKFTYILSLHAAHKTQDMNEREKKLFSFFFRKFSASILLIRRN